MSRTESVDHFNTSNFFSRTVTGESRAICRAHPSKPYGFDVCHAQLTAGQSRVPRRTKQPAISVLHELRHRARHRGLCQRVDQLPVLIPQLELAYLIALGRGHGLAEPAADLHLRRM